MEIFFKVLQIVVSILFILTVLIQQRSSGLSSTFGGQSGAVQSTKRGAEKVVFNASIILAVLFVTLSLAFVFIG
jgi:preprotein translocase subunit SecG